MDKNMKKTLVFLLVLLVFSTANGQTQLYGYRSYPVAGKGFVSFSPENPASVTQINSYRDFDDFRFDYNVIAAGEFVKGDFYYNSYYSSPGGAEYPGSLKRIATDTWKVVDSAPTEGSDLDRYSVSLWDMSYDYSTNTLYGITSRSYLVTIDLNTLQPLVIISIDKSLLTLAIDLYGTFYGIGRDANLYTVNKSTGVTTLVGSTGFTLTNAYYQSMTFDHNTGQLYWATLNSATDGTLHEVDKTTGKATLKGAIGTGSEIAGLYAPYYANLNIPVAPSNLTVTPGADGALTATVSWTNPVKAKSGNDLAELSSIVVKRNGTVVYTKDNPAIGGNETWTDTNISRNGDYTYTVYGITDGDEGFRTQQTVVVGISACDITSFPYTNGFENASDLSCFQVRALNNSNFPKISDEQARTGNSSFRFSSANSSEDYTQYLISPRLAATSADKSIQFYYNTLTRDTEQFWVGYSTTDSNLDSFTWTDYIDADATGGWVKYFKTFPAEAKFIAIRYHVMYRWDVYIDDMTIDILADKDAEVRAITAPDNGPGLTATETVSVKIRNMGMQTLTHIPVQLEVDGVPVATETFTGTLAKLAETTFTFAAKADFSALGKHTVQVTTALDGDGKTENNSLTRYITNFGDCVFELPFTESFEDPSMLACWTVGNNSDNVPAITSLKAHTGEFAWRFTSKKNNANSDYNQYLITPKLSAGTGKDKAFRLYFYVPETSTANFRIGYVTADVQPGTPEWETAMSWGNQLQSGKTADWIELTGTFPANTKYIIIHYFGSTEYGSMYVDDITVREVSGTDASVTAITAPVSGGDLGSESVTIKVKNAGTLPISNVPVKFDLNGVGTGLGTIAGPIAPSAEVSYTFASKANLSAVQTHTIKAYINGLAGDDARDNDTLSVQVTNYGPCKITTLPYETGFEESLTKCWGNYNVDGDIYDHQWTRTTTESHSGSYSIVHDNYFNQDGWLVTPKIELPATTAVFLSFWQANTSLPIGKNAIYVSTGSSDPASGDFVEIKSFTAATSGWEEVVLSLADYIGQDVYIAFRYQGNVAHIWYLDDIRLYENNEKDVSVTAITSPVSGGGLGSEEIVTVKVKNLGGQTLADIPVKLDVNGTTVGNEIIPATIKPLEEITYTFTAKVDLSEPKSYTIKVYTALDGDTNTANDASTAYVTNSGPCEVTTLPYEESFEKTDELGIDDFVCWTSYDKDSPFDSYSPKWKTGPLFKAYAGTLYPHGGNVLAYHEDAPTGQDGYLVSPKISIPSTGVYGLSFWSFNIYPDYYDYGKNSVWISAGSSDPSSKDFVEVWSPRPVVDEWVNTSVNLVDYAGKDIYIAFRYQGTDAHAWVIDDIRIDLLPDHDAGVTRILSPLEGGAKEASVSVEVTNFGAATITSLNVVYKVNDQTKEGETFTNLNIKSGKTAELTFQTKADVSAYSHYAIEVYTLLNDDADVSNDSKSVLFGYRENIPLYGYRPYFDGMTSLSDLGPVSFTVNEPGNVNANISSFNVGQDVTAGEFYDGNIYLYTKTDKNFITLTSDWQEISRTSVSANKVDDMAYDYSTHTMYAITNTSATSTVTVSELNTVDLVTGALNRIVTFDTHFFTLACDLDGNLYAIDAEGNLCTIDKQSHTVSILGYTGVLPLTNQSMAFDHTTGALYWASFDDYYDGRLIDVNIAHPGASIVLGNIGDYSQIVALFSPYPRDRVNIINPSLNDLTMVVYPNPAKEFVTISAVPEGAIVSVLDLSGRILQSQPAFGSNVTLNLNLTKGIYFIQVKNKDIQTVRKLIIK
jgi:hypothetical protein